MQRLVRKGGFGFLSEMRKRREIQETETELGMETCNNVQTTETEGKSKSKSKSKDEW